ncbi:FG-GAP-like repeat-containing protein [Phytohabitans kaempferiae]|uniref:FG-GAP-like repeat-containing protein n=1 Tax=Phytohabitans kaempferiae TaxID=1620943 RepID=A0ABV6LUJ9_9ACTN
MNVHSARPSRARTLLTAVVGTLAMLAAFAVQEVTFGAGAAHAATRADIVTVAEGEVGNSEANGRCTKYGPCRTTAWCAMFAEWVWRNAGVSPVFTTDVATAVGTWGQQQGLWKARPSSGVGSPAPGDVVVWGAPGSGVGGHVGIVHSVHSDGTITTVEGNQNDAVVKRRINPVTQRAGTRNVLISGYVSPPNVTSANRPAESVNGDRYEDLLAVDANQVLWSYPGRSTGTFGSAVRIGPGWVDNYNRIAVGDSNGDGWADLYATATDGVLWHWRNDGDGTFGARTQVGTGWKTVDWFTLADVNGDDKADILAKAGDILNLYVGSGDGGFGSSRQIGTGWSQINRFAAGDADGDGDADIWGTKPDGSLIYWRGNGNGTFATPAQVGGNWQTIREFAVLDVNGDNNADIVGVKADDATLLRWTGDGDGTFAAPVQVGNGWRDFRLASF